jgi:TonB family protein
VLDLSEGGVGVQPFLPLAREVVGVVHLDLPGAVWGFTSKGMVAWVARGGRTGIRFLDVPPSARTQLRTWLSEDVRVGSEAEKIDTEPDLPGPSGDTETDELDFQAALELIAERAQVITGSSGAAVALGDSTGMVCRASVGEAPDVGVHLRPEAGLSGYCLRSGDVVHCNDTQRDPRVDAAAAQQLKLGSAIIVPVFALGRLSGLLEVLSPRANAFDERQVARLERFAELLGSAVEEHERGRKFAARPAAPPSPTPDIPASVADIPARVADIPASAADIPASAADIPARVADIPASAADIPASPLPDSVSTASRIVETEVQVEAETLMPAPAAPPSPHFVLDRPVSSPATPRPGEVLNSAPRLSRIPEDALGTPNIARGAKVWQTCNACGHLNPPWAVKCENCNFFLGSVPEVQSSGRVILPEETRKPHVAGPMPPATTAKAQKFPESSSGALFSRRARALALGAIVLLVLCVLAFFAGRYIGRARLISKPAAVSAPSALPSETSESPQAAAVAPTVAVQPATAPASVEPAAKIETVELKRETPVSKPGANEELAPVRLKMWPEKPAEAPAPDQEQAKSRQPEVTTTLSAVTMPQGTSEFAQITAGKLIHRVDPAYPAAARAKRVSGVAVLSALVSKTGTVKDVNLISGPEVLGLEAAKAIRQWRYEPYQVAGQPVDVRTTITVTYPPARE